MTYQLSGCRELKKLTEKQEINSLSISKIKTSYFMEWVLWQQQRFRQAFFHLVQL